MKRANKFTRRDALKMMGVGGGAIVGRSALQVLATSIFAGVSERAWAQSTGTRPRKHLFIQLEGAPPRWVSDLFLTPYSTAGFVQNAMVGNRYVANGGRYTAVEYATTKIGSINAPWIWQFNTPRAGGGTRPMADLLNNLLNIRGINIGDFQHESAQIKMFNPLGASKSLVALAAENSGTPIPALDVDSIRYVFKTNSAITPVRLPTNGNMIANLMDPFTSKTGAAFNSKRTALSDYINNTLLALKNYAVASHPGAEAIFESQKGAETLLRGALGDFTQAWNTIYGKYKDIVARAINPSNEPMAGLTDLPVGITGTRDKQYCVYGNNIITATDVRTIFNSAYIQKISEHFAVAEYVLLNNISGSITISPRQFFGIPGNLDLYFDEHETGTMISLISNSLYHRALAGCLLELIDQLKAANLFDETVIDIRGEFGRYGRKDGTGSDHGDTAGTAAFYSGIIQGPLIVGNVANNSGGLGSFGDGAGVTQLSGRALDIGHMASSLATLLRTVSPITARPSVIAEQGGKIVSLIEGAKQV